jgi:GTP-binding protein HflX
MQVELAQLEYLLPRLTRMWTHLEKTRGGIGLRGPGETQLETDRRLIGHRIRMLKERLVDVQRSRAVQRQGRRALFRAALVGYTNAGKSTVLRALSHAGDVFVEDRLFATLDPLTREVALSDQVRMVVTDTVGFIRKLPHHLVASFRATLEEVLESDLLLHVIDASHEYWEDQVEVVEEVLADLGARDKPVLHVFNKIDRLTPEEVSALRERASNLFPEHVLVSAASGDPGIAPLREALLDRARAHTPTVQLRVEHGDGRLLAELHRAGEVLDVRHGDDATYVTARLDAATVARAALQGARVMGSSTLPS